MTLNAKAILTAIPGGLIVAAIVGVLGWFTDSGEQCVGYRIKADYQANQNRFNEVIHRLQSLHQTSGVEQAMTYKREHQIIVEMTIRHFDNYGCASQQEPYYEKQQERIDVLLDAVSELQTRANH